MTRGKRNKSTKPARVNSDQSSPSPISSKPTHSSASPPSQYHHYIPRFILKKFSDGSLGIRREPLIKIYDKTSQEITQSYVGRSYGIRNMYRDLDSNDCMEFEKLLSKSESSAATFVQMIVSGSKDISLTRTKLFELKKFLFIMMYRCESRRNQYFLEMFDFATRCSIEKHMRFNNIHNIHEVWFKNLKWIIKTPFDGIMDEIERASPNGNFFAGDPSDTVSSYNGPVHIIELLDFNLLIMHYVCIWQAPEGSEFILTDNCFGCYEGPMGITLHCIYVISPQYAVVLANSAFKSNAPCDEIMEMSLFKDRSLHVDPSCVYVKKNVRGYKDYTPDDVFKYRRIVIPKEKVWLVNGVFLDAAHKSVTYKSDASMYRSLLFYDKNKKKIAWIGRDYSRLKRKLFAEMNRTHST